MLRMVENPTAVQASTKPTSTEEVPGSPELRLSAISPAAVAQAAVNAMQSGELKVPAIGPILERTRVLPAFSEASQEQAIQVVEAEPLLVCLAIQTANVGQHTQVGTVRAAFNRLGFESLVNVAKMTAQVADSQQYSEAAMHPLRCMWTNAIYTALAAREFSRQLSFPDPDVAYTAGLLHNIGELVLIHCLSQEAPNAPRAFYAGEGVARLLETYHEAVGAAALSAFSFPTDIIAVTGEHHEPFQSELQALCIAAQECALDYGYTYLSVRPRPARLKSALEYLRLDPHIVSRLPNRIGPDLDAALSIR